MTALILDGRALAKTLRAEVRADVHSFVTLTGVRPALTVVRVEGDAASERYLRTIRKGCEETGIVFTERLLPNDTRQTTLERAVEQACADPSTTGVLLHLPLPPHLHAAAATAKLDPRKDVDSVHPFNVGLLAQNRATVVPNTPAGGIEVLRRYGIPIAGKRATVIGRSVVVGQPMALLLLNENATVTVCHLQTRDLAAAVRDAEIVVAAAGQPGLVTGDMLRPGAVVVDFGINVLADGSIVGDVEFASAVEVASAITPVPGGTGPVTNVMLLRNILIAAQHAVV